MRNINKYNISLSSNKSSPQRTTSWPTEKKKILIFQSIAMKTLKVTLFFFFFFTEDNARSEETQYNSLIST